jgi:hypothetical protein
VMNDSISGMGAMPLCLGAAPLDCCPLAGQQPGLA